MECRHKFTMCRLCLSESVSFADIFQVNELFGYVTAEVIRDLLQCQVSEMDGYPHVVCSICLGKLKDFKQFKEECRDYRNTYNEVFASGESNREHPIDIEKPGPVKFEPKDPLDTWETPLEEDVDPANSEEEETVTDDIPRQMRECSVALSRLDYLAFLRKRTRCESYGTNENGSRSVNDGGNPLSAGREKIAVDADPCENEKSSGSADDKVGKMDIKVRGDCKSLGDINRLESSVQDFRRELIERREEVNCCTTGLDEDEEVFTLKLESSSESDGESERGEEAPLGVNEREKEYFRCNDCRQEFDKKEALIKHLGVHGYVVNMENSSEERDLQTNTDVNCWSKRHTNEVRKKGVKRKLSDKVKRVEGVRKYVCDSCGQGFNRLSQMKIHLRIHTGVKPFACTICGKQFNSKYNLKRHKLCHTGVKPFGCEVCGRYFAHKCDLIKHGRTHTGEKPFGCEVCGRYFARKSVLINHGRIHTGEKPHGCEVCGRYFAHKSVLIDHGRTHTGEKPYGCEVCGRYFAHKSVLIDHGRTHTGEKPYTCLICCKGFARKVNLMTHRRIHSGEKPFKCEECNRCFSIRSNLRRHLRIYSHEKSLS